MTTFKKNNLLEDFFKLTSLFLNQLYTKTFNISL